MTKIDWEADRRRQRRRDARQFPPDPIEPQRSARFKVGNKKRPSADMNAEANAAMVRAENIVRTYEGDDGWLKYMRGFRGSDPDWIPTINEARKVLEHAARTDASS